MIATVATASLTSQKANAQASESFTNLPANNGSYLTRTWTGDDSVTWTAEGARTDQTINGRAICFGNSGNRWVTSPVYAGGMGTLTFNYSRAFTGTGARSIEVWVNGTQIGSSITVSPSSNDIVAYSQPINVGGSVQLEIRSTGAAQVKVDDIAWTAYSAGPDTSPPVITAQLPAPGAVDQPLDTEISVTFDELIAAGPGTVELYEEAGTTDILIPISEVTVDGATASFFPISNLEHSKTYYVLIDDDAFLDQANPTPNAFVGISSPTAWSFTTIAPDTAGPVIATVSPLNGATGVELNVQPLITFNEALTVLTGEVLIKEALSGDLVDSLDVTNTAEVTVFGDQMQLKPTVTLPMGTELYIEIPAGVVEDALGNDNLAAAGNGVWNFTTRVVPTLTDSAPYLQEFTGFSAASPTLPDGWSLTGPVTTFNVDPLQQVWAEGFNSGLRGGADLLGFQHTGSTGTLVKTLTLINGTASTITELTISYTGRAARILEIRKPVYTVQVNGTTIPALEYSTGSGDNVIRNIGIGGLSIPAGAPITITWSSARDSGQTSGSSSQIGLDDVSVSIGLELFPPAVALTTADYPNLGTTTASVSSEVTSDGGAPITSRGFVYSPTSSNSMPTIGGASVTQEIITPAEVSVMATTLTSLTPATSYTVRSFATNSEGTVYSAPITLVTLGAAPSFVTEYTQSFLGFAGSIVAGGFPDGWKLLSSTGANNYVGPWGPTTFSGGIVGGDVTNGVLGYQHSGTSGIATATLTLKNDTGGVLTQLYVSYLGRVERSSEGRSPAWTVTVAGTPVTELGYSTASQSDEVKSHLVTGLSIAVGAEFTITWESDANVGTSGSRRQIGIADVLVGLTAPVGGYAGWIDGFFENETDPLIIGFTADPDKDGIANGIEALSGGDPSVPGSFVTSELTKTGNQFTFLYPQDKEVPAGVTADYEWSTNMVDWQASGVASGGVNVTLVDGLFDDTDTQVDIYQVTATVTAGTPTKVFVRVLAVNE